MQQKTEQIDRQTLVDHHMSYTTMESSSSSKMQKKKMTSPDEIRSFDKGKVEIAKVGDTSIGRAYFEPGWSWEKCVKPIAKTNSCQAPHTQYVISGKMRVRMDDGSEEEFGPGDVGYVPPGHNAWVVGDEPFIAVDFTGMETYAKKK
jgi:oxalate decarboxylase/phosphoglucose isomerase-like protein (cupin superfamily)